MKFTLFTTGGTIASAPSEDGLRPKLSGRELVNLCPALEDFEHDIRVVDLMSKDSSNMQPDDWFAMVQHIRQSASDCDAVILLHGTDTMAWTASALSYLLPDVSIPVVLTGSMLAPEARDSDAADNLYTAVQMSMQLALYRRQGVAVVFDDVLIHGPRAAKADSRRRHAFVSVDYPLLGEMRDRGQYKIPWLSSKKPKLSPSRPWESSPLPALERNVAILPIFPGMPVRLLDAVLDARPAALVLEGFGLGGIPFTGENLLPSIDRGIRAGIPTVVRTQALFGGTDLGVYEVGEKVLDLGAISARDMTREALVVKLMLLLPLAPGLHELEHLLGQNLCGDVEGE